MTPVLRVPSDPVPVLSSPAFCHSFDRLALAVASFSQTALSPFGPIRLLLLLPGRLLAQSLGLLTRPVTVSPLKPSERGFELMLC